MRWGLIGAGDVVRKRVAAALRDLPARRLVTVARERSDQVEAFASEVGAERWHARWQDLVTDAGIDAVYVATPVHLHAPQVMAAAAAGKHVLCEKPMALTTAECDAMLDACRRAGVVLGVAYYRRFYPVVERIVALLASGAVGRPVLAQINAFERFDPSPDHPRHWLVQLAASGGGPMFDFGCHRLELLLHLLGDVDRVVGLTTRAALVREVEDTAVAALRFTRGPLATVSVTHAALAPQDTLDIYATEGSIHVANLNAGLLRWSTTGGEHHETHPPAANLHAPLIADFIAAVTDRREPAVTGERGRQVAMLEEQIYASR